MGAETNSTFPDIVEAAAQQAKGLRVLPTRIDHEDQEKRHVAIQCGRHLLVSKPLVGNDHP